MSINLTINDPFGNVVRQYVYEDGLGATNDTFHTFNTPGTFEIIQIIQSQVPRTDTLVVTVFDPVTPTFEIFNCSMNRARVTPTDGAYEFYRVYFENDSIMVLPNQISEIINFSDGTTKNLRIRGFFNNAPNNCGEVAFSFDPINSIDVPVITNLIFEQHCLNLGRGQLEFRITPAIRHLVEYSVDQINFSVIDTIANVSNFSMDNLPVSTTQACFRLVALDECDNNRIESQQMCQSNILNSLPPINDVRASFNTDNTLNIIWENIPIDPVSYLIFRSRFEELPSSFGTSPTNSFMNEETYDGRNIFDFRVTSLDTCGNNSELSILIRPVFLTASRIGTNEFDFEWNNYFGFINGQNNISYNLQILDSDNTVVDNIPIINNFFIRNIGRDNGNRYRINAIDEQIGRNVFSNIIELEQESQVLVPSAFTPNDDGLNDIFSPILVEDVDNFLMRIFNRWGEVIFVSRSRLVGWDGKDNRGFVQSGTYTYQISFNEENGNTFSQTGTFLMIK